VNVGSPVNTASADQTPMLSKDGLSLYFSSDRAGGFGGTDLWVARRACPDCAWETPVNLGSMLNTTGNEQRAYVSPDGHLLFYQTSRAGGQGGNDIWLSHRADPNDDLAWEQPVNVGPGVNTAGDEQVASYVVGGGGGTLYFARGTVALNQQDIYAARVLRDGSTPEAAVLVVELRDETVNDAGPSVRTDGREIFFHSPRAGRLGGSDLWAARRQSPNHDWSIPVNLSVLNSLQNDLRPSISHDGRTLVFDSNRPGGSGGLDIWIATRTPSGH
jgi:hypothetical protein